MGYKAKFKVWRGDGGEGELKDYDVEVNEGEVVIDVIHRLQATEAPDLTHQPGALAMAEGRWNDAIATLEALSADEAFDDERR